MSFDLEKMYALLPAVYRTRDADQDGVLRNLLASIAEQVGILEENLDQLLDDQFIETCAPWVVPYIGDLLGISGLYQVFESTVWTEGYLAITAPKTPAGATS